MTVMDAVQADLCPAVRVRRAPAHLASERSGRPWVSTYRALLVAADGVGAAVVSVAAAAITAQWLVALLVPLTWVLASALCGAYRPHVLGVGAHDLRAVALAGVGTLALLPIGEATGALSTTHPVFVLAFVATALVASGVRATGRLVIKAQRKQGACMQRVLVVGDAAAAVEMVERLGRATAALKPVGLLVPADQLDEVRAIGLPVSAISVEEPEAAAVVSRELGADAVLLVPGTLPSPTLRAVARACEWTGMAIMFAPTVVDVATSAPVRPVTGVPILSVPPPGPAGAGQLGKQLVDRFGAAIGLVLLLPVLALVAVAVRLDSTGPVFFRQTRVGRHGRLFRMIKFRTMTADAESRLDQLMRLNESDGPLFKLRADPRVTRVGRVLRQLSLDELPQLINVLLGQMSLVGPRPPLPAEVASYTPAERRRLLVSPGMTGLWQVGGRSDLDWADAVRLDLTYVESWSLPLDLRILARTVPEVLRRRGAF